MNDKLLSPIRITVAHRKWLEEEQIRTGNTFAVLIRTLIQEQITKKEAAAK